MYPTLLKKIFDLYILHNHKNHYLHARGQWSKKYFFAFSILLDGLAPILTIQYCIPFENTKKDFWLFWISNL
jgi:hypothetical protein